MTPLPTLHCRLRIDYLFWYQGTVLCAYEIVEVNADASTVTLNMPTSGVYPTFHTSLVKPYVANNDALFPSKAKKAVETVMVDGEEEFFVDKIVDERTIGKRKQYLVRWVNEGPEEDKWIAAEYLEDNEALDVWLGVRSAP